MTLLAAALVAVTPMAQAAGPTSCEGSSSVEVEACFEMNEAPEATTMIDSGPNGLHAPINQDGLDTGFSYLGAIGYHWARKGPNALPVAPERIIQIPDNDNLDPGPNSDTFTVEIRYRTRENFGNITQKGQAATRGGQWKIQNPQGIPSCLFKGSRGQVATGAKTPLNDNRWHTLTCVLTSSSVTMYVDGVFRNRKNGATGTIDNSIPMTVGGKINCDQLETTCDYFSGQIDYIRITKG
jgi:hypothetical protein